MKLRFIGKDGSMNLRHGAVYDVKITTKRHPPYIAVEWRTETMGCVCLYSSLEKLNKNWIDVRGELQ